MKAKLITAGLFFALAGVASASEPVVLSESQIDSVTAALVITRPWPGMGRTADAFSPDGNLLASAGSFRQQGSEGDVQGAHPGFTQTLEMATKAPPGQVIR